MVGRRKGHRQNRMCSPMGVWIGKGLSESEKLRRSCLGREGRESAYLTLYAGLLVYNFNFKSKSEPHVLLTVHLGNGLPYVIRAGGDHYLRSAELGMT